jgi:RNA polymerase primary sigma factor
MSAIGRSTGGSVLPREEASLAEGSFPAELDELKDLLVEGVERGYLTQEEVAVRLEEAELSDDQVRDLHAQFADHGIEVIPAELVTEAAGEGETAGAPADSDQPQTPSLDLSVEPSLDSLRLYLRSIGKVELLSASEEVSLA